MAALSVVASDRRHGRTRHASFLVKVSKPLFLASARPMQ
jgi:hypothetical protein